MEGFKPPEKYGQGGRPPGKMNASLNEMLRGIEWGEYRLGDLFYIESYKKRFDANKVKILDKGEYPYIVRMGDNNGQKGFINEDTKYLNEGNTISFGQDTATVFYQEKAYFTGDKIKILKPKDKRFGKSNALFFLTAISQPFKNFSWGNSRFNISTIEGQIVSLPVKNRKIDFLFMERFVAELQAQHVAELQAYLLETGLKDYILTPEEAKVLSEFNDLEFGKYTYRSIFNQIEQGRRLKKEDQLPGCIPFVMSGRTNTGVVNYISNPVASFPQNSITVDIFGNTFYRDFAFGAGDDTGVYWNDEVIYSKEAMLFLPRRLKSHFWENILTE